jgi:hypothetical protein
MERFTNIMSKMSLKTGAPDIVAKGIEYFKSNKFTNTDEINDAIMGAIISYLILVLIAYYFYSKYVKSNILHLLLVFLYPNLYIILMVFMLGITDMNIEGAKLLLPTA